jgi:hypothetical protein
MSWIHRYYGTIRVPCIFVGGEGWFGKRKKDKALSSKKAKPRRILQAPNDVVVADETNRP